MGMGSVRAGVHRLDGQRRHAPIKDQHDEALYRQFRGAVAATCTTGTPQSDCWQLVPDSWYLGHSTIEAKVKFGNGDCTLDVRAPQDNPSDVKVVFPSSDGRMAESTTYRLKDLNYKIAVQERTQFGPTLGRCAIT